MTVDFGRGFYLRHHADFEIYGAFKDLAAVFWDTPFLAYASVSGLGWVLWRSGSAGFLDRDDWG